jgi:hypothetical protein
VPSEPDGPPVIGGDERVTAGIAEEQVGGGGRPGDGRERGRKDVVLVGFELADLRHGWSLSMPSGAVNRLLAIAPST